MAGQGLVSRYCQIRRQGNNREINSSWGESDPSSPLGFYVAITVQVTPLQFNYIATTWPGFMYFCSVAKPSAQILMPILIAVSFSTELIQSQINYWNYDQTHQNNHCVRPPRGPVTVMSVFVSLVSHAITITSLYVLTVAHAQLIRHKGKMPMNGQIIPSTQSSFFRVVSYQSSCPRLPKEPWFLSKRFGFHNLGLICMLAIIS